jgi:UDP-N-acetyl-D-mannosaminuronic acid transferase (WecB/TagA/CpsF family)
MGSSGRSGVTLTDGANLATGETSGSTIAASTTQKLAFHGSTPVVQRASASQAAVATTGATNVTPYGFTTAAQANAIVTLLNEIRAALVEKGILKGSA